MIPTLLLALSPGSLFADATLHGAKFSVAQMHACEALLNSEADVRKAVNQVIDYAATKVLGQQKVIERGVITMLLGGNVLFQGPSGLSKTRLVKTLAKSFSGSFGRLQFMVGTDPSDVLGSAMFDSAEGKDKFYPGPIFNNFVLFDEINRAASKTQSVSLQAMEEHEVTIRDQTFELARVFSIFATQNPNQAGVFPLPHAQLDRFLMMIDVGYAGLEVERDILRLMVREAEESVLDSGNDTFQPIAIENILAARKMILNVKASEAVENYILHLVMSTRKPGDYIPEMESYINTAVGPRGTASLMMSAKALAWLRGKPEVTVAEVEELFLPVMLHRLEINVSVEMSQNLKAVDILNKLNAAVKEKLKI